VINPARQWTSRARVSLKDKTIQLSKNTRNVYASRNIINAIYLPYKFFFLQQINHRNIDDWLFFIPYRAMYPRGDIS